MARITGIFGVRGWVRLKAFTESPDGLARYEHWFVSGPGGWHEVRCEELEARPNGVFVKLAGCETREEAAAMRGREIAVERTALGEPGEGAYYWVDLVGLEVVDREGAALGRVDRLFEAGGAGVMVVKGERERMIPFVADYVMAVDRAARRITVDWRKEYDA